MRFSHVFVTRPRQESEELAAMLAPLGLQVLVQPAFDFSGCDAASQQPEVLADLDGGKAPHLLIFTSPRAVKFGLEQLPYELIRKQKIAAIGPSTANALSAAGVFVNVRPASGFTSEALLDALEKDSSGFISSQKSAVILAAPGGRGKMEEGLAGMDWTVQTLMVYSRENVELDKQALAGLREAEGILSVWTSGNTMKALSQRLQPATWFHICAGEWLVISNRLKRLARAYSPTHIHRSPGPTNSDLFSAIRAVVNASSSRPDF
jgi:uroporphyrinogen-III synthase